MIQAQLNNDALGKDFSNEDTLSPLTPSQSLAPAWLHSAFPCPLSWIDNRAPGAGLLLLLLFLLLPSPVAAEQFEDATSRLGLDGLPNAAAAWGDFDNDGWVDLYVNGTLWKNEGGVRFRKVPEGPQGNGGLWGDFDNDGFLDLYCWGNGQLYRNLGGKSFQKASYLLPERPMQVSRGAVWGDFNSDGYLDLYVGGYEIWETQAEFPDVLLLNVGGDLFTEAWRSEGRPFRARGITTADYDSDGDVDILVSNYRLQPNILWQNDGNARFQDRADAAGVNVSQSKLHGHTIGSAWGDLDNDGLFDLLIANLSHPSEEQDPPIFLRNLGPTEGYVFEDCTTKAGLQWQESYASPAFADFDNDGFLDLYLTTVYAGDHSVLYRNNGDWTFTDVSSQLNIEIGETYQAAWADFDNDGDLDLATGGKLLENKTCAGNWLKVRLVGPPTHNRSAIGAEVRIERPDGSLTRQVEGATGEGNQSELTLHFGLGLHSEDALLTIRWPDGTQQSARVQPNRTLSIRESFSPIHWQTEVKAEPQNGSPKEPPHDSRRSPHP